MLQRRGLGWIQIQIHDSCMVQTSTVLRADTARETQRRTRKRTLQLDQSILLRRVVPLDTAGAVTLCVRFKHVGIILSIYTSLPGSTTSSLHHTSHYIFRHFFMGREDDVLWTQTLRLVLLLSLAQRLCCSTSPQPFLPLLGTFSAP